jgi:hypothetical protein
MNDPRQRGGCLTAWLVLVILAGAFTATMNFFLSDTSADWAGHVDFSDVWIFVAWGLIGLSQLIGGVALMLWKRWGFWLISAGALGNLGIQLYLEYPVYFLLWVFIGPLLLFLLMRPQWDDFT